MQVDTATLEKLDFDQVRAALAARAASPFGVERALALSPTLSREACQRRWQQLDEVLSGGRLSLGGVSDIRPLIARVREGGMLEGSEILQVAYTLDAAATLKRAITASARPALAEVAAGLGSFDGTLRLVREQLDLDGQVRDEATPKLREIRRRLRPLRERIRERLTQLIGQHSAAVREPIITIRRDRYAIPVIASLQSRIPGIVLDSSDSGQTVFIEPQSVVPLNNELALLELAERDEVHRVLIALSQRLAHEPELDETLARLGELDLIQASAELARDWQLARPTISQSGALRLARARHPLIAACVPNDLALDDQTRLLMITGPNAGGKTVLLKTVGLAALMAHSGLYVAAEAPELPWFSALLCDIGDAQSIAASLSTYAGHLRNLRAIVEAAAPEVLVLIDELGSGTDPDEGAALSQAILEAVLARGARGLVTTHLAPLKAFADHTPGIQNAAMRFDVAALAPTYELIIGQPGRSYALSIAERIGLPATLLRRAEALLGSDSARLEALLTTLERQRQELEAALAEAAQARDAALAEAARLREQLVQLQRRQDELMAAAAQKAEALVHDTLQRAKQLKRSAQRDPEVRSEALAALQQLRRAVRRERRSPKGPELKLGSEVYVADYQASGPIVELRGEEVVVQLGLLKVAVDRQQVKPVKPSPAKPAPGSAIASARFNPELNIRGQRVEAALETLRDFISEAHALKTPSVRILHGKGTGALRDAVRNYLKDDKRVARFEDALPYEGGHGVTVAYLKT